MQKIIFDQIFFMKRLVICALIGVLGFSAHAQRFDDGWFLSAGFNAVGSIGTRNPLKKLDQYAFRTPFAFAGEYKWSRQFAVEQDLTFNGFKKGEEFDGGKNVLNKTTTYFSTNTTFKWYFTDYIFNNADWLDLYTSAGVGIFTFKEVNTSANFSLGTAYWFSEYFGVRLQGTGKFALNPKNHEFANNHFQYNLQAIFRL
jgi:hypothetical protein